MKYDVVTIFDTIGTFKTDKMGGKNKFTPYWFATRKELLMEYLNIDWSPDMPYCETLGHLTEAMLNDNVKVYEWEEDKSSLYFDEVNDWDSNMMDGGKNLGYMHIRAGSTPAVLLAWRENSPETYWKYLKEQPKSEYLRQIMWFWFMTTETGNMEIGRKITEVLDDVGITPEEWTEYYKRFEEYHGL